jgi:copper chaperone CopZ
LPDVASVEVNFDAKTATVTAKPNTTISRESAETALKEAGYGVTTFTEAKASAPAGS